MAHLDDEGKEVDEDPRTARIVRRMRLFVGISTAIMVIGFVTVMSVIVWRLVKAGEPKAGAAVATRPAVPPGEVTGNLGLEPGTRIIATTADGERLFVTVEAADGRQSIRVLDAVTLEVRGRIDAFAP